MGKVLQYRLNVKDQQDAIVTLESIGVNGTIEIFKLADFCAFGTDEHGANTICAFKGELSIKSEAILALLDTYDESTMSVEDCIRVEKDLQRIQQRLKQTYVRMQRWR